MTPILSRVRCNDPQKTQSTQKTQGPQGRLCVSAPLRELAAAAEDAPTFRPFSPFHVFTFSRSCEPRIRRHRPFFEPAPLPLDHRTIGPARRHQFVVRAGFDDAALVQDDDQVRVQHR